MKILCNMFYGNIKSNVLNKYVLVFPLLLLTYSPVILTSCTKNKTVSKLQYVLDKAGKNSSELEAAIEHYTKNIGDSLKLRATYYLIENMDDLFYYKGKLLDRYRDYAKLIKRDQAHGPYIMTSLYNLYGPFLYERLNKIYDIGTITASNIIQNIDMAFKVWKNEPWGKGISFEQFCEFILPYRLSDEEPEYNRDTIYKHFTGVLDSIRQRNGNTLEAYKALNKELLNNWVFTLKMIFLPQFPASQLINNRAGSCGQMTALATFAMRANGIPICTDFFPEAPYRNSGHQWNTILIKFSQGITTYHMENPLIFSKIYRRTYAPNPSSLAMQIKDTEKIPDFFRISRMKDVTDEYGKCFDIVVPINKIPDCKNKIAYLSIITRKDWVPTHWAWNRGDKTAFSKMREGVVYLPSYFDGEKTIPANDPITLDSIGRIDFLKPNMNILYKKLFISQLRKQLYHTSSMIYGCFQGANSPSFDDAVDLLTLTKLPEQGMNIVQIKSNKKFKYLRYLPPMEQNCRIGELSFFESKKKLRGIIIGKKGCEQDDKRFSLLKAMDDSVSTSFISRNPSGDWVGLELKKPTGVDEIRFSAEFSNYPTPPVKDHAYELLYWNNDQWISCGSEIIKDSVLAFCNVPSNALYMICDYMPKSDETYRNGQLFTYNNGKMKFW